MMYFAGGNGGGRRTELVSRSMIGLKTGPEYELKEPKGRVGIMYHLFDAPTCSECRSEFERLMIKFEKMP